MSMIQRHTPYSLLRSALAELDTQLLEQVYDLACHAALPVALNAKLLHLLRVNFVPEAPAECESYLLLSPLCQLISEDLYEIEPDVRRVLLRDLKAFHQSDERDRLRSVALLVGQFLDSPGEAWQLQPALRDAQWMTAYQYVNPSAVQTWLTSAEQLAGQANTMDRAWYVALRREMERVAPEAAPPLSLTGEQRGREDVIEALLHFVTGPESGDTYRSLVIEGPAGRGKTWVLRRLQERLRWEQGVGVCYFDQANLTPLDLHRLIARVLLALRTRDVPIPLSRAALRLSGELVEMAAGGDGSEREGREWEAEARLADLLRQEGRSAVELLEAIGLALDRLRPTQRLVLIIDGFEEIDDLTDVERKFFEPLARSPAVSLIASSLTRSLSRWKSFQLRTITRPERLELPELDSDIATAQINQLFREHGSPITYNDLIRFTSYYRWQNPEVNRLLALSALRKRETARASLITADDFRDVLLELSRSLRFAKGLPRQDLDWLIAVASTAPNALREAITVHTLSSLLSQAAGRTVNSKELNEWRNHLLECGIARMLKSGDTLIHTEFVELCLEITGSVAVTQDAAGRLPNRASFPWLEASKLEQVLRDALPVEMKDGAGELAFILTAVAEGDMTPRGAAKRLADPRIAPILRALAGTTVDTGSGPLRFGPGVAAQHDQVVQTITIGGGTVGSIIGEQLNVEVTITDRPQPPRFANIQTLVGFTIDLSASMERAMVGSRPGVDRLESFRQALEELTNETLLAVQNSRSRNGNPEVRIFAYGYGVRGLAHTVYNLLGLIEVGRDLLPSNAQQLFDTADQGQARRQPPAAGGLIDLFAEIVGEVMLTLAEVLKPYVVELQTRRPEVEQQLSELEGKVAPIEEVVSIWRSSRLMLSVAREVYLFGRPDLSLALQRSARRFADELRGPSDPTIPVLFVLSGGGETPEIAAVRAQLRDRDVVVITCLIADQELSAEEEKHLYRAPLAQWGEHERALFDLATPIRPEFREHMERLLVARGWRLDDEARLFVRLSHHRTLQEFIRVILSPINA